MAQQPAQAAPAPPIPALLIPPVRNPTLGDFVDLARQLTGDDEAAGASLRHRDRAVGRELAHLEHQPLRQILGWLHAVQADDGLGSVAGRVNASWASRSSSLIGVSSSSWRPSAVGRRRL